MTATTPTVPASAPAPERWYAWKEQVTVDGRTRLITPWADPNLYEFPFDMLFTSPEDARAAKHDAGADDEGWVLVEETYRPVLDELDPIHIGHELGSALLGHAADALIDRGHDRAAVGTALAAIDVSQWWDDEGGPLLDRLEWTLGLTS